MYHRRTRRRSRSTLLFTDIFEDGFKWCPFTHPTCWRLQSINSYKYSFHSASINSLVTFSLDRMTAFFQRSLNSIIAGLDGAKSNQNDVLIDAPCKIMHHSRLLEWFIQFHVSVSSQTCIPSVDQLPYFGHEVTFAGISPNPQRLPT